MIHVQPGDPAGILWLRRRRISRRPGWRRPEEMNGMSRYFCPEHPDVLVLPTRVVARRRAARERRGRAGARHRGGGGALLASSRRAGGAGGCGGGGGGRRLSFHDG